MKNNYSFFKRGTLAALLLAGAGVSANAALTCASALPADDSFLMSLSKVNLTIAGVPAGAEEFGFEWTSGVAASVKNAAGEEVATAKGMSRGDYLVLSVTPEITEKGVYTIEMPAKAFYVPDWDAMEWPLPAIEGAENEAFTLTYTVVDATPVVIEGTEPASGSYLTSLKQLPVTLSGGGEEGAIYPVWTSGVKAQVTNQTGEVMEQYAVIASGVMNLNEAITTPGTYTITIPEDAMYLEYENWDRYDFFAIYGSGNKQTKLTYTVVEGSPIVIEGTEPPSGSLMTRLKQLPVTLSGGYPQAEWNPYQWASGVKAAITNQDGEVMEQYATIGSGVLNINKAITTPGTYTITIPAGALYSLDVDYETYEPIVIYGTESAATTLTYTVVDASPIVIEGTEPPSGSVMTRLKQLPVTLSGGYAQAEWNPYQWASGVKAAITNQDGEVMEQYATIGSGVLNINKEITTPGIYTITIPEGALYSQDVDYETYEPLVVYGTESAATTLTYTVVEAEDLTLASYTPNADKKVGSFDKVTVVWNGVNPTNGFEIAIDEVEVMNAAGEVVATATASKVDNELVLTLDETVATTGIYTITLPEEMIYGVDDEGRRIVDVYNAAVTLTVEVDEVVGIAANKLGNGAVRVLNGNVVAEGFQNASVELFTLSGARVATTNVAPGLYIVKVSHLGGKTVERILVK